MLDRHHGQALYLAMGHTVLQLDPCLSAFFGSSSNLIMMHLADNPKTDTFVNVTRGKRQINKINKWHDSWLRDLQRSSVTSYFWDLRLGKET